MKKIVLLFFWIFSATFIFGAVIKDSTLIVTKIKSGKEVSFANGDKIVVKLKNKSKVKGELSFANDSVLLIDGQQIPLSEIKILYKPQKMMRIMGAALTFTGIAIGISGFLLGNLIFNNFSSNCSGLDCLVGIFVILVLIAIVVVTFLLVALIPLISGIALLFWGKRFSKKRWKFKIK